MKISRLVEWLNEFGGSYDRSGFAARPDDSGIRGKGVDREPNKRLPNFPYDRDVSYGQPAPYDRGSSGGSKLGFSLTPRDDSHFSVSIIASKDDLDEIMGSPILMARAMSSDLGSSVPGVTGWANNPPKDWDDEGDELDESPLNIDTSPSDEQYPDVSFYDFQISNGDHEFVSPGEFGSSDSHVIGPDPWSAVNTRLSSRGLYGLMPKESAWDRVSGMVLGGRKKIS